MMSEEVISPFLTTNPSATIDSLDERVLAAAHSQHSLQNPEGPESDPIIKGRALLNMEESSGTSIVTKRSTGTNTTTTNGSQTQNGVANGSPSPTPPTEALDPPGHGLTVGSGRGLAIVCCIFIMSAMTIYCMYDSFPNLDAHEKQYMKLPRNIEDAKMLGSVLNRYKEKYYVTVLCGVCFTYIFLQTFAIPGSIFLSILSGFLFPFWLALVLVCFCSALGATCCYLLSYLVGRRIIYKYFPARVAAWSNTVRNHRDNLLNYIIFLRVTPFLPNWFINITSPVIGVPVKPFFIGTFVGVAAPSFVAIHAGTTLNKLTSSSDALSWNSLLILMVLGVASLIPVMLKDRLRRIFS